MRGAERRKKEEEEEGEKIPVEKVNTKKNSSSPSVPLYCLHLSHITHTHAYTHGYTHTYHSSSRRRLLFLKRRQKQSEDCSAHERAGALFCRPVSLSLLPLFRPLLLWALYMTKILTHDGKTHTLQSLIVGLGP